MKKSIIAAIGGAIVGAGVAYIFVKKKYSIVIDELSDQVNDFIVPVQEEVTEDNIVVVDSDMDKKIKPPSYDTSYINEVEKTGYNDMFKEKEKPAPKKSGGRKKKDADIEYIDPVTFGDDKDYDTLTFTYYADGVVANEDNEEIADYEIISLLGENFEDHFGEYEQDSVNIKNNKTKTYYEVLKDDRCYSEVVE